MIDGLGRDRDHDVPIGRQPTSRCQCSLNGCQNRYMHDRKTSGQITIASGTRNGRGRFGRVKRRTSKPMLTTAKASSVPIDTMSPRKPKGSSDRQSVGEGKSVE